jgi:hypothetical protein
MEEIRDELVEQDELGKCCFFRAIVCDYMNIGYLAEEAVCVRNQVLVKMHLFICCDFNIRVCLCSQLLLLGATPISQLISRLNAMTPLPIRTTSHQFRSFWTSLSRKQMIQAIVHRKPRQFPICQRALSNIASYLPISQPFASVCRAFLQAKSTTTAWPTELRLNRTCPPARLLSFMQLQSLTLARFEDHAFYALLSDLSSPSTLSSLTIAAHCCKDSRPSVYVDDLVRFTNLTTLSVAGCAFIGNFGELKTLTNLSMQNMPVYRHDLDQLSRLRNLRVLGLRCISRNMVVELKQLGSILPVQELIVHAQGHRMSSVNQLRAFLLFLSSKRDLQVFALFALLPKAHSLRVTSNSPALDKFSADCRAVTQTLVHLKLMQLHAFTLTVADCKTIATLPSLKTLDIGLSNVKDDGLFDIASAPSLEELHIANNSSVLRGMFSFRSKLRKLVFVLPPVAGKEVATLSLGWRIGNLAMETPRIDSDGEVLLRVSANGI